MHPPEPVCNEAKVCYRISVRVLERRGFTLIEIVFTMSLVVLLAAISIWTLQPAKGKAPSKGMAIAIADEFEAARQLAIATGHPVALGIPTDGGKPVASSIFRLQGWNKPVVDWSKGYSGDYPGCGFVAAKWSGGGTWDNSGEVSSVVSKVGAFDLDTWLPDQFENDYIYCFTPEGGLVTNDLSSVDGRYPVVVGKNLSVSGGSGSATVNAATEPITLMISPYGGVEVVTGIPGGNVPSGGSANPQTSAPVARTTYEPGEVRISTILVTPRMEGAPPDEGFCVPGQTVTMEVYAYDPEGRGLFAKWKQTGNRGIFTYPDGGAAAGAVLAQEVDRMEFVDKTPDDPRIEWVGAPPPPGGLFHARWAWTVPIDSTPGTVYNIEVDVKDAKGECQIVNPPPPIKMTTAPKGRIIAEKLINGIWQIVQFNPDGSGQRVLSPAGVTETMPSLDRAGLKMALLQGTGAQRYVKIRPLDGGPEHTVAGPGEYTSVSLSPDGNWISYRKNNTNELITSKVDGSNPKSFPQSWTGTGTLIKKSRSGFSQDSQYLIYETGNTLRYCRLGNWGTDAEYFSTQQWSDEASAYVAEQLFAPTSFNPGGGERIMFSLGNHNSVLVSLPWTPGSPIGYVEAYNSPMLVPDLDGGGGSGGSDGIEDDFPSISWDGTTLVLNRSPYSDGQVEDLQDQGIVVVPWNGSNFVGPVKSVNLQDVRRAVWVP